MKKLELYKLLSRAVDLVDYLQSCVDESDMQVTALVVDGFPVSYEEAVVAFLTVAKDELTKAKVS